MIIMDVTPAPSESTTPATPPASLPHKPKRTTLLDAALAYHALGLRVVLLHNLKVTGGCSCKSGKKCALGSGKHPRFRGWKDPGGGVMLETPEAIQAAWEDFPRSNVGIITGSKPYSNIVCIDVDPRHGGTESLEKLIADNEPFPPTWEAKTGNNGRHIIFEHPGSEYKVKNDQPGQGNYNPKLGEGIDIRGDGGQFVVEPSVNASGKYKWVNPPGGEVPLAPLPAWLRELIAEKKGEEPKRKGGSPETARKPGRPSKKSRDNWAKGALKAELEILRNAPAGQRNNCVNRCSMNLFQIVGNGLGMLDDDVVVGLLYDAAKEAFGDEFEPAKVRASIESGRKKGLTQPRLPPNGEGMPYISPSVVSEQGEVAKDDSPTQQPSSPIVETAPTPPVIPPANFDSSDKVYFEFDNYERLSQSFIDLYYLHHGEQSLYYWNETWWKWDREKMSYRSIPLFDLRSRIHAFVAREFYKEAERQVEETGKRCTPLKVTRDVVTNVIQALSGKCCLSMGLYPSQPAWIGVVHPANEGSHSTPRSRYDIANWIALRNGLLNVKAIENGSTSLEQCMHPPSPYWFSRTCLPYDFDPDAECPLFIKSINLALEGDQDRISLIQEFFGYILARGDLSKQKFLVLIGDGNNGKGGIISALIDMIGHENYSSVSLEQFGEPFGLYSTVGMLANIYTEINEIDKISEGILKQYTAGEPMQLDIKYRDPVKIIPTAKLVFSMNEPPKFIDKSDGIWRRLIAVPFNYKLQDHEVIEGMATPGFWASSGEIQGIFKWALAGLIRLNSAGWTKSELTEKHKVKIRNESSNHRLYLSETLEADPGDETGGVPIQSLYDEYKNWCKENGYERATVGKIVFNRTVESMFKAKASEQPVWHAASARTARVMKFVKYKQTDRLET